MSICESPISCADCIPQYEPPERVLREGKEKFLLAGQTAKAFDLLGVEVFHLDTVPLVKEITSRLHRQEEISQMILLGKRLARGQYGLLLNYSREERQTLALLARIDRVDQSGGITCSAVYLAKISHQGPDSPIEINTEKPEIKQALLNLSSLQPAA